jgi:hypothetical protein
LKRHITTTSLLTALACGISLTSQAQITKTPQGYIFKRKLAVGMSVAYKMETQVNLTNMPKGMGNNIPKDAKMTLGYSMKIKDIKGNTASITTTIDPMMMNGKKQSEARTTDSTIQLNSGQLGSNDDMARVFLPQKPIKEGEKYTFDVPLKGMEKPQCQFVGMKSVNGKQAALILMNYGMKQGGDEQQMSMKITATALVDVTDGWPLSMTIRGKMDAKGKDKKENKVQSFNASFNSTLTRK